MKKPCSSTFSPGADSTAGLWTYNIPKPKRNTYAGLNFYIDPIAIKNQKIFIGIKSENAYPLYLRLYSFNPEYSQEEEEETFVPIEIRINLTKGFQEIMLDPLKIKEPEWWYEDNGNPIVNFFSKDVRIIEFGAEIDKQLGPISDKINIQYIILI